MFHMNGSRVRQRAIRTLFTAGLVALVVSLRLAAPVAAGPVEDAKAAYDRGDYATAIRLFRPLADQGYAEAQYNLGAIHFYGQGVLQDYAAAGTWFRKAADQGYAAAQYGLAFMYHEGQGVPKDFTAAVAWYRKAADQGFAEGQYGLANMYFDGQGVPRDYAEAVTWFRKAADQGLAPALNNLGNMYLNGQGVPQDYVQAYMLFNVAAARAPRDDILKTRDMAVKNRDSVAAKMTPAQIAEAQKVAREWTPKSLTPTLAASEAVPGEWGPWPSPKDSPLVSAGFRHDDGGALVVMCDTSKRLISIGLEEPRAQWRTGEPMSVTTRADDGTQMQPSTGVVIGPTRLVVGEESTWDLHVMGQAKSFFAIGVGGYARIFPTVNFRKVTETVLRACGDHW
jgi:TPR repeat protein